MDVTDLVRRLVRRWSAAVVVVLIALLAASAAWLAAGSTEQSSAAVVIVPPALGDAVSEQNPLLNLDNNLAQLATVLASSMSSQDVADLLRHAGATAPFQISTVTGTNPSFAQLSPQIVFTVTAASAQLAVRTSTALVYAAQYQLDVLQSQAGAPATAKARLVTVVSPTDAVAAGSGRVRAAGAVGLGVLVLGLLGLLLVDELLSRRAGRAEPTALPETSTVTRPRALAHPGSATAPNPAPLTTPPPPTPDVTPPVAADPPPVEEPRPAVEPTEARPAYDPGSSAPRDPSVLNA